jgi:hypothetical protein
MVKSYISKINFNVSFHYMCGLPKLSLPCRLSKHFKFSPSTYYAGNKIFNALPGRTTGLMNEKQFYENTQCTQLQHCQLIYDV